MVDKCRVGDITKVLIGGNTSCENDGFNRVFFEGELEFFDKNIDSGFLEAGGEISDLLRGEKGGELVRGEGDGFAEFFLYGAENGGL